MEVRILQPFSVDTPEGDVRYAKGQVVPNGEQHWIDKGLAEPVKDSPKTPSKAKSAD